jgi:hypothetical protein
MVAVGEGKGIDEGGYEEETYKGRGDIRMAVNE